MYLKTILGKNKRANQLRPYFHRDWYARQTPRLDNASDDECFYHYLTHGMNTKSPHPLFDPKWYLENNPDVARQTGRRMSAIVHYIEYGCREMRSPHPMFDIDWYLSRNRDVSAALLRGEGEPLLHYLQEGEREGRSPHPLFSRLWYKVAGGALLETSLQSQRMGCL